MDAPTVTNPHCASRITLTTAMVLCCALGSIAHAAEVDGLAGKVFGEVLPTLNEHLELMDRHEALPEKRWVGADRQSNQSAMDELLDEAIVALGTSGLANCRQGLRDLERQIQGGRQTLSRYRRDRISAPKESDLSVGKVWRTSKEDYDELIAEKQKEIERNEKKVASLKGDFAVQLRAMGLELSDDSIESMLSSVSGDDFVSMCVVFDNVKMVTSQLQKLTEESGEDLATAKRYYGMYVVLLKVLDRVQQSFIGRARKQYMAQLKEFGERAESNIKEAETLIADGQGNADTLRINIHSNKLTQKAAQYYMDYLREQAHLVEQQREELKKALATAMNTYKTVRLSSDVAELLSSGRRDFDALMKLRMPSLRDFRNSALQRQFQMLTDQMRGDA